ncbi:MAG: hypothetical protein ACYC27_04015 [Armatimonadota bacterium]
MVRKAQILFLVLLGSYPPLFMYARNQGELNVSDLILPLVLSIGIPAIITIAWYPMIRNWSRAALVAAWFSISFWMAGLLGNNLIFMNSNYGINEGIITILIFVVLYLAGRAAIVTRSNIDERVTSAVAALSGALVIYSCIMILPTEVQRQLRYFSSGDKTRVSYQNDSRTNISKDTPNIIDIVLDGYARSDVLETRYKQSNEKFLNELRKRGFHVLDKSTTNYSTTALSLTSMLNMEYVRKPKSYIGNEIDHVAYMIQHNKVAKFLENHGYWYVTFESGSTFTDGIVSDEHRTFTETMGQYQMQLMEYTPISMLTYTWLKDTTNDPYELHRRRVSNSLNGIASVDDRKKPLYMFAHVICPHPPFVFHASGVPTKPDQRFNMWDADKYVSQGGNTDEYIQGYREQVTHINRLTLKSIDRIISMMNRSSIIIIHSDHGPGSKVDFNNVNTSDLGERMSNLMAIHFPDGDYDSLYPSITGVNIYRTIFNKYFDAGLPILPDEYYFAHWNKPFTQISVNLKKIEEYNNKYLRDTNNITVND